MFKDTQVDRIIRPVGFSRFYEIRSEILGESTVILTLQLRFHSNV